MYEFVAFTYALARCVLSDSFKTVGNFIYLFIHFYPDNYKSWTVMVLLGKAVN